MKTSAGYFPEAKVVLEKKIENFLEKSPDRGIKPELLVCPHGSLGRCGEVAGKAFGSIDVSSFNNAVILGPKNFETGPELGFFEEEWETPLGTVEPEPALSTRMELNSLFKKLDYSGHQPFVDVPAVFMEYLKDGSQILPVTVSNSTGEEKLEGGGVSGRDHESTGPSDRFDESFQF